MVARDAVETRSADNPLAEALVAIGDRWSLLLISVLLSGRRRFGELQECLPGIAPTVLSQRLRHLRDHGLLFAEAYSERPPRFVYELTASGHELADAVRLLTDWALRQELGEVPRHLSCGTALEVAWFCPTCQESIDRDADDGAETEYI